MKVIYSWLSIVISRQIIFFDEKSTVLSEILYEASPCYIGSAQLLAHSCVFVWNQMSRSNTYAVLLQSQCGNLRIFLPLWFYVKSILVILKPQKLPFWPFEQLWILNFWELLTFLSVKFFQKLKFKAYNIVKMAVFDLLKSDKIDFTQNLNGWNILIFHIEDSQLACTGL